MDICQTGNGFNGMVNKSAKGGSAVATALKEAKTRRDGNPVSLSSVSPAGRKAIAEGIKAEGVDTKEARKKVGLAKRAITNAAQQQSYIDNDIADF